MMTKHSPDGAPEKLRPPARQKNWKIYAGIIVVVLVVAVLVGFYATENGSESAASPMPKDRFAGLIGGAPTMGPADARVTVIDFHDLSCPHCLALDDQLQPLLKKYQGRIRFASVPVNILYNMGYSSTVAAMCAREQGKYWPFHRILLEQVRPFVGLPKTPENFAAMKKAAAKRTPEMLEKLATQVDGMDIDKLSRCMMSGKYDKVIRKRTEHFSKLGFAGVPVLLINGIYFDQYPNEENIDQAIQNALQENRG